MNTYRLGATLGPLIFWNLVAAPVSVGLFAAGADARGEDRGILLGTGGLLVLVGPLSFIAYLVRYFMIRVTLASDGLVLSNREVVPWHEIRGVRLKGLRIGPWDPLESVNPGGCGVVIMILLIQVVLLLFFVILILWVLRTVFLPVVVLYSPLHSRVVIELRDDSRLVYRDLDAADVFVETVAGRIGQRF